MRAFAKAALVIMGAACLCVFLTGCMNGIEVSGRAFVQSVWVDKNGQNFIVGLQIFEGAPLHGEGETISQALSNIEAAGEKKLFLGHCRLVMVGNGITSLKEELGFFLTSNKLSPAMRIALLERGAGFEEFSESPPSLSALSNAAKGARTVETDSVEFFGESEVLLPILRKSAGKAVFSGCEVVRDGVRAYELSEEGVLARGLILGKLDGFTLPVRAGGAVVTVVVDRVKKPQDGELEIAGRITESVGDFQLSAIETALAEKLSGITGMRISCYLKEQKKF